MGKRRTIKRSIISDECPVCGDIYYCQNCPNYGRVICQSCGYRNAHTTCSNSTKGLSGNNLWKYSGLVNFSSDIMKALEDG
jgi:predicted RNA-binding Zn-ribbon protein involved in translation (DUF1610 family)